MPIVSPMGQVRPAFADKNGKRLSGGKVYTYEPGTLTPKPTYSDALGTLPNPNPINLDESGEADIYLDGNYRFIVLDHYGVMILDQDNFRTWASGIPASSIIYGDKDLEQLSAQIESDINNRYTKEETYSKSEVDASLTAIAGGHKAYATLAAAQAAQGTFAVNSIVEVTNDGANNGTYQWNGTTLTKSAYDPLTQAKADATTKANAAEFNAKTYASTEFNKVAYEYTKNKYDSSKAVTDSRISGVGVISAVTGAKRTGYIPVIPDQTYTMSWTGTTTESAFYAFFANEGDTTNPIAYSISGALTSPKTITVPTGANFIVVTLKHGPTSVERTNFQIELGSQATAYEAYNVVVKPQPSILADAVKKDELESLVTPLTEKDYEISIVSKNLFNGADLLVNKFLSTANGGISAGTGWLCSGFIPVVAGQTYTLSGTRARQGISFFPTNTVTTDPALLYDNTALLPLTVTAPTGANYAVIALESATVKGYSNIQFEQGSVATEYLPYGFTEKKVSADYIDGLDAFIPPKTYKSGFKLTAGTGTIKAGLLELGVKVFNPLTYIGNPVFNFNNDKYNNVTIRVNGDDVAPVRMMGATIGANHGYSRSNLTLASHGKTNADVGSVWTDGTNQWVIVQINSTSVIGVTCRTANIGFSSSLPILTHVSGATNTASFTPTAVSLVQWYPMLKNHSVKLYADGNQITDTTIDSGYDQTLKVVESYDLMEKSDIVEWLILNGGKEVTSYSATSALNVNNVHSFDETGGDTLYANFFTYKALSSATDLMFTQSARLTPGVDGLIKYYVPRSIPFVHESVNYDFSIPSSAEGLVLTNRIDFTVAKTEVGKAVPDRLVMFNNTIGYAVGYLPILDADPSVRNSLTSKGIQISQFEAKVYPYLVDGLTTLDAGANYTCVAYRKYFKRPAETRRTVEYNVQSDYGNFLFLDWHGGDFKDTIILPEHMQNKSFDVIEKTDNVTLLTKVATGQIAVQIGTVTSNARLILKFK